MRRFDDPSEIAEWAMWIAIALCLVSCGACAVVEVVQKARSCCQVSMTWKLRFAIILASVVLGIAGGLALALLGLQPW